MTATARADIGARYLKPDDKHGSRVAYSFVMTSPSAAISIGSLLSFRTLGVRPAETEGFDMAQTEKEDGKFAGVASRCRRNRCGRQ
jgi:hypothetical protein